MRPTSRSLAPPTRSTSSSVSFAHLVRTLPFSCSHFPFSVSSFIRLLLFPEEWLQRTCHHAIQRIPVLAGMSPGFHGLIDPTFEGVSMRSWLAGSVVCLSLSLGACADSDLRSDPNADPPDAAQLVRTCGTPNPTQAEIDRVNQQLAASGSLRSLLPAIG